jgi:DNA-directed RNA polymerase specialized sigma24 family protein
MQHEVTELVPFELLRLVAPRDPDWTVMSDNNPCRWLGVPRSFFPKETFSLGGTFYKHGPQPKSSSPLLRTCKEPAFGKAKLEGRIPKTSNHTPPFVNSVDLLGRPIGPGVLSAANEVAARALSYAEKFVGDSCVAMNLLEEVAATVSEAVRAKEAIKAPPIRDLRAYVYRAFLRRIADERRGEKRRQQAIEEHSGTDEGASADAKTERKLALKQILSMSDSKTREIIWSRIEGRSWDDIAYGCLMSNHAARLHYSKALREIRNALRSDSQRYTDKVKLRECEARKKLRLKFRLERASALLPLRVLRAVRGKGVTPVVFRRRISHHEKEDILAEVDSMFE